MLYDLTKVLSEDSPRWPGQPKPVFHDKADFVAHGLRSSLVQMSLHTSTHIDAPGHFPGGDLRTVDQLPLELLCGPGVVVRIGGSDRREITARDLETCSTPIEPGDRVILSTGWNQYSVPGPAYDIERYMFSYPGLGRDAVDWLVTRGVAWVGSDTPTPDHPLQMSQTIERHRPDLMSREFVVGIDRERFPLRYCHRTLLAAGIPMIEQLGCQIDDVPAGRVDVWALPIKVRAEGGQVRVVCGTVA